MSEEIAFNCGICKRHIDVVSDAKSTIVEKQVPPSGSGNDLIVYRIESRCIEGEIHLNLVVVDSSGQYRGLKHSEILTSKQIDDSALSDIKEILRFGNGLSKALSATLQGSGLAICGEQEDCELFARVLNTCFALDAYQIKPWISSIADFVKQYSVSTNLNPNTIALFDSGLIRQVSQTLDKTTRMELRNRTVYHAEDLSFSINLLKMLKVVPNGEDRTMRILVTSQLDTLQKNLKILEDLLNKGLSDTMVLRAGDLPAVSFVNQILEQILSTEELARLKAQIKEEDFEILTPHLIRRISKLGKAMKQ